jgi:hypothetical protein
MVSSTSAAALVSENEKRRKQTMERAKAVHVRPLNNAIDFETEYLLLAFQAAANAIAVCQAQS